MMHKETLEQIDPQQFNFADRELRQSLKTIEGWGGLTLPAKPRGDWIALVNYISGLQPEEGKAVLCCLYYGTQGAFGIAH